MTGGSLSAFNRGPKNSVTFSNVTLNGGGSNNSVSVSNVSVSDYTYNTYTKEGFYIGGGKTSLKNITFSGNSSSTLRAKGDTVSLDGLNFVNYGYMSLSGNGNISAQNITNTVGGGISMTGGAN